MPEEKKCRLFRVTSEATDACIGQAISFVLALLVMVLGIWKMASIRVTEFELFLGLLMVVCLSSILVLLGVVFSLERRILMAKSPPEEPCCAESADKDA
jgi:predicted membrane protein